MLWAAGAAAVIIVAVVAAVMVLTGRGEEREAVEAPAEPVASQPTPAPTPAPVVEEDLDDAPELFPDLVLAQQLVAAGDMEAAEATLEAIPAEVIDGFGEDDFDAYQELEDVLAGAEQNEVEQAVRTLRRGLKIDSPKLLRRAMRVLNAQGTDRLGDRPELLNDINLARRALEVRDLMWRAHEAGDPEAVLEHAATLNGLIPGYSRIPELRSAAAATIEAEAEAAAAADDLDRAIARLQVIAQTWPERPGLADRIQALKGRRQQNRQLADVLERAREHHRQRQPEQGLAVLADVTPNDRYAEAFAATRQQLETLFAEMDQSPPRVELAADVELDFRKNDVVTLTFRVRDDLRVASVRGYCRSKDATSYRELPLEAGADGVWTCSVGPDVHANETLELYVTATDPSGHVGSLGSAEAPLELKRKRWYQP
jgi:hypothetical protein